MLIQKPIGADVQIRWEDDSLTSSYISFSTQDEMITEDTGVDEFGVLDTQILYTMPDGVGELQDYIKTPKSEFIIHNYDLVYSENIITLTVEKWEEIFKPIKSMFDENASWDGIMFETYDDEDAFVRKQEPTTIWTYVDSDNGTSLVNGYQYVNRIGYFVTEVPFRQEFIYEIEVMKNTELTGEDNASY